MSTFARGVSQDGEMFLFNVGAFGLLHGRVDGEGGTIAYRFKSTDDAVPVLYNVPVRRIERMLEECGAIIDLPVRAGVPPRPRVPTNEGVTGAAGSDDSRVEGPAAAAPQPRDGPSAHLGHRFLRVSAPEGCLALLNLDRIASFEPVPPGGPGWTAIRYFGPGMEPLREVREIPIASIERALRDAGLLVDLGSEGDGPPSAL